MFHPMRRAALALSIAVLAPLAFGLAAQDSTRAPTPGRVRGRVVADSGGAPVVDALVSIEPGGKSVRTDTAGRYDFPGLAPGQVLVRVRSVGFRAESTTVDVKERRSISLEFRLAFDDIVVGQPAGAAPTVTTQAAIEPDTSTRLKEFDARKARGVGRFLAPQEVAKWAGRRTSEMLSSVGSVRMESSGLGARVSNGRAAPMTCTLCRAEIVDTVDPGMKVPAVRRACYLDVLVDGVPAYVMGADTTEVPFDVNSVSPENLSAVEVYADPAQVPAKFVSRFGSPCGALVLWRRPAGGSRPGAISLSKGNLGHLHLQRVPVIFRSLFRAASTPVAIHAEADPRTR